MLSFCSLTEAAEDEDHQKLCAKESASRRLSMGTSDRMVDDDALNYLSTFDNYDLPPPEDTNINLDTPAAPDTIHVQDPPAIPDVGDYQDHPAIANVGDYPDPRPIPDVSHVQDPPIYLMLAMVKIFLMKLMFKTLPIPSKLTIFKAVTLLPKFYGVHCHPSASNIDESED